MLLFVEVIFANQDISAYWFNKTIAYYQQSNGSFSSSYYTEIYHQNYLTKETKILRSLLNIKEKYELGLDNNSFITYLQYKNRNIGMPKIFTIDSHQQKMFNNSAYYSLKEEFANNISLINNKKNNNAGINLFNQDVGGTNISVSLKGNISISGLLSFEDRDNISANSQENESWNLDITQTQKFNLEGKIGDKLTIKAEQNSESDFDWENSLLLEYNGAPNEIVKNVSAGNISLNLPHTQLVSVGMGKREGLFGVKLINQLGPLSFHTIIGREKVQKTSQSIYGGQSEDGFSINDYNFIKDKYFFIDQNFKRSFYPLDYNGSHIVNSNYVVLEYEVFKRVTTLNGIEPGIYVGTAYLDPSDTTAINDGSEYKQEGIWKKLTENVDYEINRMLGYVRLNTPSSSDVVAIHYRIGQLDATNSIVESEFEINVNTNIDIVYNQQDYDICLNTSGCEDGDTSLVIGEDYEDINGDGEYFGQDIILKLIKDAGTSTPTSKTWPLMFKNVYSLGASNIDLNTLEVDIVHVGGQLGTETVSNNGNSFLNIFGLDNKNENGEVITGGDGIIDLNVGGIINPQYGELILPFHMPFSYDEDYFEEDVITYSNGSQEQLLRFWGNPHPDLDNIFEEDLSNPIPYELEFLPGNFINIYDNGPSMYYSTVQNNITAEHEFIIQVKHSSQSSTINLGFMIAEGSETLTLDGSIQLVKGVDYTIDYFTGTLNLVSERAKDPTANIRITYDQNELVSFDQKIIAGSYFKYDFNEDNNIFGGAYFYTQTIAEEKVDVGYEPLQNKIWHIGGKFSKEYEGINNYLNKNTYLNLEQPSKINFLTEFAQIDPNPNSLGVAYLDDFESSKRSTYIPITYGSWKASSPPLKLEVQDQDTSYVKIDINVKKELSWYNPYDEVQTQDIWPNIQVSQQANNQTTKTLTLETDTSYHSNSNYWSGISVPLFASDYNQTNNKYIDLWMNIEEVVDDSLMFNINIGHISEDINDDSKLNSEDALSIGGQLGNGILDDGEDIGIDKCTDSYEDGWGGCLCSTYNNEMLNFSYSEIYDEPDEYCEDENAQKFIEIYDSGNINNLININTNFDDPNLDNFDYNEGDLDYSNFNGTEKNSTLSGFNYPDTEDLNNNQSLDNINSYFSYSFNLKDPNLNIIESESEFLGTGAPTGWKLYRIPLQEFIPFIENTGYSLTWEDVRTIRLWIESENSDNYNVIQIAKIELVGNEWQYLGNVLNDNIGSTTYDEEDYNLDDNITIQVINSEENDEYNSPDGVEGEYDEYAGRYTKEQSLVIDFSNISTTGSIEGGLNSNESSFIIKNFGFSSLPSDKQNSFFAYKNLEMYINGVRDCVEWNINGVCIDESNWNACDTCNVEVTVRMGKDDNYYEIRQPIPDTISTDYGWENIRINLDELTNKKTLRGGLETYFDVGYDGCEDLYETGFSATGYECLDSTFINSNITVFNICDSLDYYFDQFPEILNNEDSDNNGLIDICETDDPNGDNCIEDEEDIDNDGYTDDYIDDNCTEGNGQYDYIFDQINQVFTNYEPVDSDLNSNNIYDTPAEYIDEDELWSWDDDIYAACGTCSKLSIKGEPAINRIDYVMVGVVNNNSSNTVYGKVLLNEMRMTGVKENPGSAFFIDGTFDLGELLTVGANFSRKQADFHRLEERLGTGANSMQYSVNFKLNANKLFREDYFNMPVNIRYNKSISSPKYIPGSDIIQGDIGNTPEIYQTLKDYVTLSTTFNTKLSTFYKDNLLYKYLLDNTKINYSYKWDRSSNPTTLKEELYTHQLNLDYSLKFDDNEWYLFKKDNINDLDEESYPYKLFKDFKFNLTPEKIEYDVTLNSHDKITVKRINYGGTSVYDTSMTISRSFKILNYKALDNLNVNYRTDMNSNLNDLLSDNTQLITGLSNIFDLTFTPGTIKTFNEQFSFTYTPEFMDWLGPRFSYNPRYSWTRDLGNNIEPTADLRSENDFSATFTLSVQKFIENFYSSESSSKSSSRSSRRSSNRRSSSRNSNTSSKHKPFEIDNPYAKTLLKFLYTISQRISNVNLTYKYNTKHTYDNITADFSPGYNFRLGLNTSPIDGGNIIENLGTSSNQIVGYSNYFYDEFKFNTSFQLTKNLSLSNMEYRKTRSKSLPSNSYHTITKNESYFPLGANGLEGFPIFKYSINVTGLEKYGKLNDWFKSVNLSHSFSGESSETIKDGVTEKIDLSRAFNPLIGINSKLKTMPINIKLNYNNTLNISNTGTQTERITKDQITFSVDYTKKSGFRFPLPLLRDIEIENEVTLRLDLNFDENFTDFSYVQTNNLSDFENTAFSKSVGIKPTVTYSFSKFVDGDIYLNYVITENHTTGKKKETNVGFKIRIYFESFD